MKHRQVITLVTLMPWLLIVAAIFTPLAYAQTSINIPTADHCLAETGNQVYVSAAEFVMGNDATYPEEGPANLVSVSAFWLDSHEVTNAQFAQFVVKTGYVTTAERPPNPSDWPADVPSEFLEAGSTLRVKATIP
jgi:formylglycine-generating enzyme required for sulfatase activity